MWPLMETPPGWQGLIHLADNYTTCTSTCHHHNNRLNQVIVIVKNDFDVLHTLITGVAEVVSQIPRAWWVSGRTPVMYISPAPMSTMEASTWDSRMNPDPVRQVQPPRITTTHHQHPQTIITHSLKRMLKGFYQRRRKKIMSLVTIISSCSWNKHNWFMVCLTLVDWKVVCSGPMWQLSHIVECGFSKPPCTQCTDIAKLHLLQSACQFEKSVTFCPYTVMYHLYNMTQVNYVIIGCSRIRIAFPQ